VPQLVPAAPRRQRGRGRGRERRRRRRASGGRVMRIGAKVPNFGPMPTEVGVPAMSRRLEAAGFDSLWISDHVVMPGTVESRYPFSADGRATWDVDAPWYDAVVLLGMMAAVTERAEL